MRFREWLHGPITQPVADHAKHLLRTPNQQAARNITILIALFPRDLLDILDEVDKMPSDETRARVITFIQQLNSRHRQSSVRSYSVT